MRQPDRILHDSLQSKFDWLIGADTAVLIADLDILRTRFDIRRVCPSFGGIIEGRGNVARLFDATVTAPRQLTGTHPVSPLTGSDWARALGPHAVVDPRDTARTPPAE